jgi:ABC-type transport system substrate-binding protein
MKGAKWQKILKYFGLGALLGIILVGQFGWGLAKGSGPVRLVFAQGTDAETLDPHSITSSPNAIHIMAIYDTLVGYDENLNIVPRLAKAWEVSEDGMTITFHLREGVTFHDGTPFNADAVVFNINRLIDPKTRVPLRTYIAFVESARALDEYTVEVKLRYPHGPALARFTAPVNSIVSPAAVEKYGADFGRHPVGTGPFKFVEWVRDDYILLERNEDYWGEGPYVDELLIRVVPEDGARVLMLEAGEADVIVRVPPPDVPRLRARDDTYVVTAPSTRVIYVGMNTQHKILKDLRVRQAINYAVNKQAIVEVLLQGYAKVMDSPLTPQYFSYKSVGKYDYNPELAKALLREAGYPKGFAITLFTPKGRYLMDYRIAEAIQGYLASVGIAAEVKTMEWATYISTVLKPLEESPLELFLLGWGPWILDPDQMLYPLFHSSQWPPTGFAASFYKNERVDELLQIGTSSPDPETRRRAYEEAQELIWNDAPWLFLHYEQQIVGIRSGVKDVIVLPIEVLDFRKARKE